MQIAQILIVALIALLHVYILVLEMFFWTKPLGLRAFGQKLEQAQASAVLAANQGLYNGFLAAGLIFGLLYPEPLAAKHIQSFFLACILVAGLYGGFTANRRIIHIQAVPAAFALGLLWLV